MTDVTDRLTDEQVARAARLTYNGAVVVALAREVQAYRALRPDCPTCEGSGRGKHPHLIVDPADIDANGHLIPYPCPDCTDGKMPLDKDHDYDPAYLATCAAVIAEVIKAVDPIRYTLLKSLADDTIDTDDLRRLWTHAGPTSAEALEQVLAPFREAFTMAAEHMRPALEEAMGRAVELASFPVRYVSGPFVDEVHVHPGEVLRGDLFAGGLTADPRPLWFSSTTAEDAADIIRDTGA